MILSDPPKFQERTNPFGLIKTARRTPLKVTIFFTILIYGELSNVSDAHFLDPQIFSTRHFAIAASEINSSLTIFRTMYGFCLIYSLNQFTLQINHSVCAERPSPWKSALPLCRFLLHSAELPLFIAYLSSAVPRHDETR